MLSYFKEISLNRTAWLLLALAAFALEATGIYFQYGMGLVPCVMCVYERLAFLGVLLAGLIGAMAPRVLLVRLFALALWGFSAFKGFALAFKHHDYQANPAPWNQCEFKPEFPQTMPFDQWFPSVFAPGPVNCSQSQWDMFGLGMPAWIMVAFGIFTITFVIVLLSQFKRAKPQYRSVFR